MDREGGSYFQEWSAVFALPEDSGGRIFFYYPRLQVMSGAVREHKVNCGSDCRPNAEGGVSRAADCRSDGRRAGSLLSQLLGSAERPGLLRRRGSHQALEEFAEGAIDVVDVIAHRLEVVLDLRDQGSKRRLMFHR